MAKIAKKHSDKLNDIKKDIEQSYTYFQPNYKRYNDFMRFIFVSTLTEDEKTKLNQLGKPPLEFNVLEAYISRLLGEFMMYEPGVTCEAAYGLHPSQMSPEFLDTMYFVEAHIRDAVYSAHNDKYGYVTYRDLLGGGFSVSEVYTEYTSKMSFEKKICAERVFDPTLCFFDPTAKKSHKGDGEYCGQLFPMTFDEIKALVGSDAAKDLKYNRSFGSFSWSYATQKEKIALVADYYTKKKVKQTVVKLSNGKSMLKDDYLKGLDAWSLLDTIVPPPVIADEKREEFETICQYRLFQNEIIDYKETDFKQFPLVFIDGNSTSVRNGESGDFKQVCKPYLYNAAGAQRLKNFSGQTMAAEIENIIQSKLIAPLEGIPEQYLEGYTNYQSADVIIYKSFMDDNPELRLSPPQEVQRSQTPQIVPATFTMTDPLIQGILGSYDAQMGIQGADISGKAIQQGALQSNKAADPYKNGYIRGLDRVAEIIMNLIPLYYTTPRSIPIRLPDGSKDYKVINDSNQQDAIYMNYSPEDLMIKVEAGASFAVQKQIAVEHMTDMMKISPEFNKFMSGPAMSVMFDNMEFRGADRLSVMWDKYTEESAQTQQQMQQMQQQQIQLQLQLQQAQIQNIQVQAQLGVAKQQLEERKVNDKQVEAVANIVQKSKADEYDRQLEGAKLAIQNKQVDVNMIGVVGALKQDRLDSAIRAEEIDAEMSRTTVDAAIAVSQHVHDKHMDMQNLAIDKRAANSTAE